MAAAGEHQREFPEVNDFQGLVLKDITAAEHNLPKVHQDISIRERQLIQSFKDDTNIIVKPADNGGAIVIVNIENYGAEALQQLGNRETYKKVSEAAQAKFSHCMTLYSIKRFLNKVEVGP